MTEFARSPGSGLILPARYVRGRMVKRGAEGVSGQGVGVREGAGRSGRGRNEHFDVRPHVLAAVQEMLYKPCGCGSGKKWKFCCWRKDRKERVAA